jgi:hypothetical protein
MNYTPGPWDFRGSLGPASNPHAKGPHIVEANGTQIAIMSGWRSDVTEANARLIAAAPELLKELRHLVRLLEPAEKDGAIDVPGLATLNAARAAIRKAAGE